MALLLSINKDLYFLDDWQTCRGKSSTVPSKSYPQYSNN